ncbi:MAG: FCD domain-containing protein [Mesorhizobium sp.]
MEIEASDDKESEHRQARLASQFVASEIISGNLKPGAEIQASDLSASSLLSVGAMLEGIPRLLANRLVTDDDDFFRVAEQSPDDLADLMHTRFLLEGVALRDSIMNGDEEWERSVTTGLQELVAVSGHARRCPEAIFAHKRFHQALISASRLRRVREYLDMVYDQCAWYAAASDSGSYSDFRGYQSLTDAAVARDIEAASEQLRLLLFSAMKTNGTNGDRRS